MDKILERLQEIKVERPSDQIIAQIRQLINSGELKSGDRLPSERKLSEMFKVGRGYVREAIQKLEFYGILKTLPQSGTVVAGIGEAALEGLINNVLELNDKDFHSLSETRAVLEINAARMASQRATDLQLDEIQQALNDHKEKALSGVQAVEEDLMFHLKIAEACDNSVLRSLLLIIIPDVISFKKELDVSGESSVESTVEQHQKIYSCIKNKDMEGAEAAMREHLGFSLAFGKKEE